ncbi:MAG: hypothetical protein KDK33_11555 [Leptospiraceae bacterium]|nr:hypothetical protein [Leptospiraceae bacterium]
MQEVVDRLWDNPNLQSASIIRRESQILGFLKENHASLQALFKKPEYFPEMNWNQAIGLFLTVLTETATSAMEPALDAILDRLDDSALIQALGQDQPFSPDRSRFKELILSQFRNKSLRDVWVPVLDAHRYGFYDRYVPELIARHKVIYFETVRRERLDCDSALLPAYFACISLFRPFFYLTIERNNQPTTLQKLSRDPKGFESGIRILYQMILDEAGSVPEKIIKAGVESRLDAQDFPDLSGAGRLISIIVSRAADYDPTIKTDRGAETPDKSWFNISRRNARIYGYDSRFLDELYQIAGEEGW